MQATHKQTEVQPHSHLHACACLELRCTQNRQVYTNEQVHTNRQVHTEQAGAHKQTGKCKQAGAHKTGR